MIKQVEYVAMHVKFDLRQVNALNHWLKKILSDFCVAIAMMCKKGQILHKQGREDIKV